jgi:hypothetical protein
MGSRPELGAALSSSVVLLLLVLMGLLLAKPDTWSGLRITVAFARGVRWWPLVLKTPHCSDAPRGDDESWRPTVDGVVVLRCILLLVVQMRGAY